MKLASLVGLSLLLWGAIAREEVVAGEDRAVTTVTPGRRAGHDGMRRSLSQRPRTSNVNSMAERSSGRKSG
jgi:hypothetical protein